MAPRVSDHDFVIITASIRAILVHKPNRKVFIYAKGDFAQIQQDQNFFNDQLTDDYIQNSDIDTVWSSSTDIIRMFMDNYIPTKIIRCKVQLIWMTDNLREECNKKS